MKRFEGFPAGSRATIVPSLFFSDVLGEIADPAELVVTVYLFFASGRKAGAVRYVTVPELAAEVPLRQSLRALATGPDAETVEDLLRRGLAAATARGTVLRARRAGRDAETGERDLYLVHTDAAREALGAGRLAGVELLPPPDPLPDDPPPSIYALYEENIGTIAPLIAAELAEAETAFPPSWIVAAFTEAVAMNKRNWRYILRILERWRAEGRTDATVGRDNPGNPRRRDLEGRYRRLVRR